MRTMLPPTPAPTPQLADRRLTGLDGLRAIAVILVVVYHLFPHSLRGGFLGVDVFFVISGFLITTLLLRDHERGTASLVTFWQRRARRLLPALGVVVAASCAVAALIGGDVLVGIGRQLFGALTFSSNWVAIAAGDSYHAQTSPQLFRNLWSLAVEEQWYLVWPLVLIALTRLHRATLTLVLLLGAAVSAWLMAAFATESMNRAYLGTDSHAAGLVMGAALAALAMHWNPDASAWRRSRHWLSAAGLAGLGVVLWLAFTLGDGAIETYAWGITAASVATLAIIVGAVIPGSWLGRALDWVPLRWIGERSYGLYLWHWPILVLLDAAAPTVPQPVIALACLVIAGLATWASYRYIEVPIRQRGLRQSFAGWLRGWRGSPVRKTQVVVATAAVAAAVFLCAQAIVIAPRESSASAAISAGAAAIHSSELQDPPTIVVEALPEKPPLPTGDEITAIGDSVMLAAAPALQAAYPGIAIDAAESRQFSTGADIAMAMAESQTLRPWVFLGLGTNGAVSERDLDIVEHLADAGHFVVLVEAFADRDWIAGVNLALSNAAVASDTDRVSIAPWAELIAPNLSLLASDNIHPNPEGGEVYVAALRIGVNALSAKPSGTPSATPPPTPFINAPADEQ